MTTPPIQPGDRVTFQNDGYVYRVVTLAANGRTAFCLEDNKFSKPKSFEFKVSDLRRIT